MNSLILFFKSRFNVFFVLSSLICFCYLLFRAIYSSLVCDELTTFFRFIQPRAFLGNYSDANNHLLNTLLSHISISLLGFSSISIRLFSLLSILIYFVYTYRFSREITSNIQRVLFVLVMLFSFNFLQFFGLSRGYGYSFAFLLSALYHLLVFSKNTTYFSVKDLVYLYVFIALALYANLAMLLTVLTISLFLLLFFYQKKQLFHQLTNRQKTIFFFSSICYVTLILMFIYYSLILKSNGALYFGSLSSFWNVVVVSQLSLLVENNSLSIQYFLIAFLILFTIIAIFSQKNFKIQEFNKFNIFFFILVFNLIGIEVLALLLKVNYPRGRVALHLYMILILALFFIDTNNSLLKTLKLIAVFTFCLVPIHNVFTTNYKNNTIWPLDYFPKSYYTKIVNSKTRSGYYSTVAGNSFRGLNYVKHVYENNGKGNLIVSWKENDTTLFDSENHPGKSADFIISNTKEILSINHLYKKVDSNSINDISLWERINKLEYNKLENFTFESPKNSSNEFIDCASLTVDSLNNKYLLMDIEFDLNAIELPFNGILVVFANDEVTNQSLLYENYPIRFQKNFKNDNKFRQRLFFKNLHPSHKLKLSAYIWNLKKETVSISNGKVIFYKFSN